MSENPQEFFEAALALPEEQRAELAQLLLESLSDDQGEPSDEGLLGELDRRRAEVDQRTAEPIPWAQLRDEG